MCKCLETVLVVTTQEGGDVLASGCEARDAVEHIKCTGQPSSQGKTWPQVPGVMRIRNLAPGV